MASDSEARLGGCMGEVVVALVGLCADALFGRRVSGRAVSAPTGAGLPLPAIDVRSADSVVWATRQPSPGAPSTLPAGMRTSTCGGTSWIPCAC